MATAVQKPMMPAASNAAAVRAIVEAASLAMVREFLAKRRYKKTLDMLSTELVSRSTNAHRVLDRSHVLHCYGLRAHSTA